MSRRKFAVLIGASEFPYAKNQLEALPSAATDVRAFEAVLSDPALGGFTDVQTALDLPHWEIMLRVNQVMRDAARDDQILIYYSGHGLLDTDADLYLTTVNTDPSLLHSTALPVASVRTLMSETECRRIIVILDCCYSGAAQRLNIEQIIDEDFKEVGKSVTSGYAVSIIAAAGANGGAYAPADGGESVMTAAILDAVRTGAGDRDGDGVITLMELYDYTEEKLKAQGFPAPYFFTTGVTGSLTIARTNQTAVCDKIIARVRAAITAARQRDGEDPEAIFTRAEEILAKPAEEIQTRYEAVFALLRDWANGTITLEQLTDQWYQFDKTRLVATDKQSEVSDLADQWNLIRQCRLPIHDLVCPSYILDRNYHFLDWNPMFDELVAKPMGLTRFRHAEDFILKLKNHREVIERSQQLFSEDAYPMVHIEDLEYESPKYGLVVFKKIAAQIPSEKGGLLAWSVNLNITRAEKAEEMWADLNKRLSAEVNWSIYAKLYDRMLLNFDPYLDLVKKSVGLLGNARVIADCGAGTGNVTTQLLEQSGNREVWALESNEEMIEQMRRKLLKLPGSSAQRVKVFKGDLMVSLREFEQNSFDGAVMVNTLYAIPDRSRCLREIYRVLKPGGTLVYSTSTSETDLERLFRSIEQHLTDKKMIKTLRPVVDLAYERHIAMQSDILRDTPERVVAYARQAGFCVEDHDVLPREYEGAVSIVRAVKPRYLEEPKRTASPMVEQRKPEKKTEPRPPQPEPPKNTVPHIFISYAREDQSWCDQIMRYLQPAERSGKVSIWADTEIQAGQDWEDQIEDSLNRTTLGLLLITPSFLASKYVSEKELPFLLQRAQEKKLTIVPIMIEKALVEFAYYKFPDHKAGPHEIKLSDLQIEMHEGKPISLLDKPTQNLFIDRLAQTILTRVVN